MLIRIVRMTFEENKVEDFLHLFEENRTHIRNFPGCKHLELWKDYQFNHIYTTYSIWEKESDLDNYRSSDLFKKVWGETKSYFKEPPKAFSSSLVDLVT